jgi:mannosyltransferase
LGYHLDRTDWRAGAEIPVRLYWWAAQAPQANYKLFLHLAELDDTGKVAQLDTEPMMGFSPTTRWEAGELVVDELRLPLDARIRPGRYRLLVGVYHPETVQNLAVLEGAEVLPGDRVVLTEVEILDE